MLKNKKIVLFAIFFFFAIFLSIIDIIVEKIYFSTYTQNVAMQNALHKSVEREAVLTSFLDKAEKNLYKLRNSSMLIDFLDEKRNIKETKEKFLTVALYDPNIMQVRYIDKNGIEKIRIDRDQLDTQPYIVSQQKLQNKSTRYYFTNSKQQKLEKVWFSKLDLNIERGKIEFPFKATIRGIIPISKNNEFNGILIINYFANEVINKLTNATLYKITLFDKDGYIIAHQNKSKYWGRYTSPQYNISEQLSNEYKKALDRDHFQSKKFFIKKIDSKLQGEYYLSLELNKKMQQQQEEYKQSEYIFEIVFVGLSSLVLSILVVRYFSTTLLDLNRVQQLLQRLRLSSKASKVGFYEYDFVKKTISCSNEVFELLGIEKSDKQLTKEQFLSAFSAKSIEEFEKTFDKGSIKYDEISFEAQIITKEAQEKYILHKAEYNSQNSNLLYGSLYDITDIKLAQIKLEEQSNYIHNVLNSQTNLIIVTNQISIYDCNKKLLDFFGVKNAKEFKEKYTCVCDEFINEDGFLQKEMGDQKWIDYIYSNSDQQHLVKMNDIYGRTHVFDISCSKEKVKQEYYVVTFTDITQLYLLQNDLEKEVLKKSHEIIKKDTLLTEQSKLAQMGSMIANIAHQWKQPLSVISTSASGVGIRYKMGVNIDKQEVMDEMDDIVERVNYLADNINVFRNFIKDDKQYKNLILQDEIQKGILISSLMLKDNGIKLIDNIDYNHKIELMLVSGELPEVIINILNNAKDALVEKFIKNPWVKIELIDNDNTIILTIEDNAGGIPQDIIDNIFDEYFTTKSDDKGTGLGLHMCQRIIEESSGGRIYVNNTENGAKFTIEFEKESMNNTIEERR